MSLSSSTGLLPCERKQLVPPPARACGARTSIRPLLPRRKDEAVKTDGEWWGGEIWTVWQYKEKNKDDEGQQNMRGREGGWGPGEREGGGRGSGSPINLSCQKI